MAHVFPWMRFSLHSITPIDVKVQTKVLQNRFNSVQTVDYSGRVDAERNFKCLRLAQPVCSIYYYSPTISARNLGKAPASTNAAHSFGLPIKRELLTTANLCSARFAGTDYRVACPFCAQFGPESRLSNVLRLVENFWLFIRLICSREQNLCQ